MNLMESSHTLSGLLSDLKDSKLQEDAGVDDLNITSSSELMLFRYGGLAEQY